MYTSNLIYNDNLCRGLDNTLHYKPQYLALLVPKTFQDLILLRTSTMVDTRKLRDAGHGLVRHTLAILSRAIEDVNLRSDY